MIFLWESVSLAIDYKLSPSQVTSLSTGKQGLLANLLIAALESLYIHMVRGSREHVKAAATMDLKHQ